MVLFHALEVARPGRPPPRGDVDLEDRPDPLDDALGGALGRRKPDGQAFGDAPGEEGTLGVGLEGPDGVEQGARFLRQLPEARYARLEPVELRAGQNGRAARRKRVGPRVEISGDAASL